MHIFNMTKKEVLSLSVNDYSEYYDNALNILSALRQGEFTLISVEDKLFEERKQYNAWKEFERNK